MKIVRELVGMLEFATPRSHAGCLNLGRRRREPSAKATDTTYEGGGVGNGVGVLRKRNHAACDFERDRYLSAALNLHPSTRRLQLQERTP